MININKHKTEGGPRIENKKKARLKEDERRKRMTDKSSMTELE